MSGSVNTEQIDGPITMRVTTMLGNDIHPNVASTFVSSNGTLVLSGPDKQFIHAYAAGHWLEYGEDPDLTPL